MEVFTPLEQFEILIINPLEVLGVDLSITNMTLYLFFVSIFGLIMFWFGFIYNPEFIPVRLQLILELAYSFVLGLVKQQAGSQGIRYFPLFFSLFIFILLSNLFGLVPFSFTVTSHFAITFALAFSLNFGLIIIGFLYNGLRFLKLFVPSGVPAWLLPLVIAIEIFSYLIRTFSLSIRLFCNMTAGHTLLHMITSFSLLFFKSGGYVFFLFSGFLTFAIFLLELGIAFIQAYVFVILAAIYLNDSLHPGH